MVRLLKSFGIAVIIFGIGIPGFHALAQSPSSGYEIKILGHSKIKEGFKGQWIAVMTDRPTTNSHKGYEPTGSALGGSGALLPTEWEEPVDFRWDFGDETGIISTGERTSIIHELPDDGDYTLTVEAWINGNRVAKAEKEIKVRNARPLDVFLAAVEIDPAQSLYEITTCFNDVPKDTWTLNWDFGDGEQSLDGKRKELHRYLFPGTYPLKLTVIDDDGGEKTKSMKVVVAGAGAPSGNTISPMEEEPKAEGVSTSFEGKISGSFNTAFKGEVRSLAGMHLAPVNGGKYCRFMLTAWDDSKLVSAIVILDLVQLREEGATYLFQNPNVSMNFEPTLKKYLGSKNTAMPGATRRGLGRLLAPAAAILNKNQQGDLKNKTGVAPGSRELPDQEIQPPAFSPLGIDEHHGFEHSTGTLKLTFIPNNRAIASFDMTLLNTSKKSPYPTISFNGDFVIDLQSAQRDGLMMYNKCGSGEFSVKDVSPEKEEKHVYRTPRVGALFTGAVDVSSLSPDTFQLTYPSAQSEELIPVETYLLRRAKSAYLKPKKRLMSGVRYTVRIKTGEEGVRGLNGVALEDTDESGWYKWSFTTRLDFEAGPESENLSCHVFQTVRDAPLIAGKPAVTRVYADWKPYPHVFEDAQVKDFVAHVAMHGSHGVIATEFHTFVRPDLWKKRGIDLRKAEHTANLYWTPDTETVENIPITLSVETEPGKSHEAIYQTRCSTPKWEYRPELTFDYYLLEINEWEKEGVPPEMLAIADDIAQEAETYAQQVFPLSKVRGNFGGVLSRSMLNQIRRGNDICNSVCASNFLDQHADKSSNADIIIGIGPMSETERGGGTPQRLAPGTKGVIVLWINSNPAHRDRFVYGLVHEIGHALDIEHLPTVDGPQRAALLKLRDKASPDVHWYQGIEGFRIALDGKTGWNKSSSEGNEEGSWLTPLMYPGTIPFKDSFIARHQYLKIQKTLEGRGGKLR